MPDILRLHGPGRCPACGQPIVKMIRCQWGLLPGGDYSIGDEVKWLRNANGSAVLPFTLRNDPILGLRWNCGDAAFRHVLVFDVIEDGTYPFRCPRCGITIVGSAAVVRDGLFHEILVVTEEEQRRILGPSLGKADIVIVREDGSLWPREDWDDHVVHYDD